MAHVTHEQIKAARIVNLYAFLLSHHPDAVKQEGNSLRLRSNNSVSVKRDYSGFSDWSTGETGNAVTFLVKYLGYELPDAVLALLDDGPIKTQTINKPSTFVPPTPFDGRFSRLFAYLMNRGISNEIIQRLIDLNLLYQAASYNNAVFINDQKTYAELRGTFSYKPFHGLAPGSSFTDYWSFTGDADGISLAPTDTAIACESAIDAISLYCLQRPKLIAPIRYCSIGGVGNQQRIDHIKTDYTCVATGVDNDKAGDECRQRNAGLSHIIPKQKDFNEDWIAQKEKGTT